MRPTVVADLKDTSRLMTEEIFGPVVCIVPFDTAEEVCFNFLLTLKPHASR
jgi:acyl-CoA reductase-like NAD-dependent aldehyde dehydrogenase